MEGERDRAEAGQPWGAGNNSREMETDEVKEEERERKMESQYVGKRARQRKVDIHEIDIQREGNTEREAKKAKPETGRIKGTEAGRAPASGQSASGTFPGPAPPPPECLSLPTCLGAPGRLAALLLPQISQGQAFV